MTATLLLAAALAAPPERSGIYPHLAYSNADGECGTGAVVPWAGKLWLVTYAPHRPNGSADKLYSIDSDLTLVARPESVGGTPAGRMIHRESNQLFIGPHAIAADGTVRTISPKDMPGRLTGIARHLTDPAGKVYYATMEEGFYEVDVKTLAVTTLYADANASKNKAGDLLPGYHGKGLYSGQGRLVYANNGELSPLAQKRPDITSGCLAEWDGKGWVVVRRNQFTDVTGPGGITGNGKPESDPIWAIGWDHRSLILMLRDGGKWTPFRLPKASHSYDGAHGWNTEWPRIRDIGETDLLMTMHGAFWRFPRTFSLANPVGIRQRSTYLKVIGDFCRWNDRIVMGCDDSATSEFLNKRRAKGSVAGPGKSHSNLWFLKPEEIDKLGPKIGRGAVWLNDPVKAGEPSDPYLFAGFQRRAAFLAHDTAEPVTFALDVDGKRVRDVTVPAKGSVWVEFPADTPGEWIRATVDRECKATVWFTGSDADKRTEQHSDRFADWRFGGNRGVLRARGDAGLTLAFGTGDRLYTLAADLTLTPTGDAAELAKLKATVAVPAGVLERDAASLVTTDDAGRRWRFPGGEGPRDVRVCREVCTERDLFNAGGTFYELPAENAGGFAKVRPVATHGLSVVDYCSWRGLLVLAGLSKSAAGPHVVRSTDGEAALWVGAVDDLWTLGKPRGVGGPWKDSAVKAGVPSDPYLMTGFDRKVMFLSHQGTEPLTMRVEVDVSGAGDWHLYKAFEMHVGPGVRHEFPAAFQAYWLRVVTDRDTTATVRLEYE